MHTVPGNFGGGGTWVADRAALSALVDRHFSDPNDPRRLSVAVINTAAPAGSARRLKTRLEGLGYLRVSVANGTQATDITTITGQATGRARPGRRGYGRVVAGSRRARRADVTVRLGSDTPAN